MALMPIEYQDKWKAFSLIAGTNISTIYNSQCLYCDGFAYIQANVAFTTYTGTSTAELEIPSNIKIKFKGGSGYGFLYANGYDGFLATLGFSEKKITIYSVNKPYAAISIMVPIEYE